MKKSMDIGCGAVCMAALLGGVAWMLGADGVIRASLAGGHWLDWVMGGLCLIWLMVILKAPWDLYFQAQGVVFEIERSKEKGIPVIEGREAYVRTLRTRLACLAVGAHLLSAALVAAATYYSGGKVGYYFAAFYLVATVFRPLLAAYAYLRHKLQSLNQEVRYPREDVQELRASVQEQTRTTQSLATQLEQAQRALKQETETRAAETRELRQNALAVGRELETTVARLTDNQDVIKGIQAFVRLIGQSAPSS